MPSLREKERKPVHLRIGQTLLKQYAPGKSEDLLFDIVHHLNLAREVEGQMERAIASGGTEPGSRS